MTALTHEQVEARVKPLVWEGECAYPFGTALYAYRVRGPFQDGHWIAMTPQGGWIEYPSKNVAVSACDEHHAQSIRSCLGDTP